MALAKLTLTVPREVWIGELSREYPALSIRVLAAFTDGDDGVGLAEFGGAAVGDALAAMRAYGSVPRVEVLQRGETQALVQFETTMPLLLLPARDSGVPLEMPFEIRDGEAVWEVTAPRERLSALAEQLDAFGIDYRVEFVRERITDEQLLTERQRDLLVSALEAGYYDTPREISLTGLADRLGIAKSTASETLHRAEEAVVKEYVRSLPDGAASLTGRVGRPARTP